MQPKLKYFYNYTKINFFLFLLEDPIILKYQLYIFEIINFLVQKYNLIYLSFQKHFLIFIFEPHSTFFYFFLFHFLGISSSSFIQHLLSTIIILLRMQFFKLITPMYLDQQLSKPVLLCTEYKHIQIYTVSLQQPYQSLIQIIYLSGNVKFTNLTNSDQKQEFMKGKKHDRIGFRLSDEYNLNWNFYTNNWMDLQQWNKKFMKPQIEDNFEKNYQILHKLGQGTTAMVYLAQNKQTHQKVAVKIFEKERLQNEKKGLIAVYNEIRIMSKLHHKNLSKLIGIYQDQNSIYMIINYLDGGRLHDKMNYKRFNIIQIQKILKILLEGVKHLLQNGIIHRDLKPENILLKNNQVVIIDFGLATEIIDYSNIYTRCGSPGYIAPQILNNKSSLDHVKKRDIFSIGIIAYILTFSKFPYSNCNPIDVLKQNKKCQLNFEGQQKYNPNLINLIRKMIEIKPENRYSVQEALDHQLFKQQFEQENSFQSSSSDIQLIVSIMQKIKKSQNLKLSKKQSLNQKKCQLSESCSTANSPSTPYSIKNSPKESLSKFNRFSTRSKQIDNEFLRMPNKKRKC